MGREPNFVKVATDGNLFWIANETAEDLKATTVTGFWTNWAQDNLDPGHNGPLSGGRQLDPTVV